MTATNSAPTSGPAMAVQVAPGTPASAAMNIESTATSSSETDAHLSGPDWCSPGDERPWVDKEWANSRRVRDKTGVSPELGLEPSSQAQDAKQPFLNGVERFLDAIANARQVPGYGGVLPYPTIAATFRHECRAFLMHWSWSIAHYDQLRDPSNPNLGRFRYKNHGAQHPIPGHPASIEDFIKKIDLGQLTGSTLKSLSSPATPLEGRNGRHKDVKIKWWHGTVADSVDATKQMCVGFGIHALGVAPALNSWHCKHIAIDFSLWWTAKAFMMLDANFHWRLVRHAMTPPQCDAGTGTNIDLAAVGRTYKVIKFGTQSAGPIDNKLYDAREPEPGNLANRIAELMAPEKIAEELAKGGYQNLHYDKPHWSSTGK